jgi:hypothetical protein
MHRGTLASQGNVNQTLVERRRKAPASQLDAILDAINKVHETVDERMTKIEKRVEQMPEMILGQVKAVVREEVKNMIQEQVTTIIQEQVTTIIQEQMTTIIQEQVTAIVHQQLASVQLSSPSPSYADVARTPPGSQPSNIRTISMNTTPSTMTDTLYCTVDTSSVGETEKDKANPGTIRQEIEKEMRDAGSETWRCVAVTKDPRNAARIRITCRNESELALVKSAAEKTKIPGARVLRDQLYPVKVDNANRTAVLQDDGQLRPGVVEMLEKENEVKIAKVSWLSRKELGKAYGSMVVYVTKGSDAVRLLQGQYFHVAGESAYTRVFEPRRGPIQCFRCLELGHKAYSCPNAQVCGRCAQPGHRYGECHAAVPKCVPCGGPHESSSRHCRVLYPTKDA